MTTVVNSPTPPTSPSIGDQWRNSTTGRLYEWMPPWVQRQTVPAVVPVPQTTVVPSAATQFAVPVTQRTPVCSIGTSPPSNPLPADLWWNSATGSLFIYYDDGNTKQWVSATGASTNELGPPGPQGPAGQVASPDLAAVGMIAKLWTFNTPGGEACYSSPIGPINIRPGGGNPALPVVVFVAWDWYCYALKVSDGTQVYRKAAGNTCYGRCQAADVDGDGLPEIFFPSHDGKIWSIEDDFTSRWQFNNLYAREASGTCTARTATTFSDTTKNWATNSFMRSTTVTTNNATVNFPSVSYTGKVQACSGNTITVSPAFTTQPAVGAAYTITPAYASDNVFMHAGTLTKEGATWFLYVTGFDNMLVKLNANTGAIVWKYATLENIEPYPLLADVNVDGALEIIISSLDGTVRCFKTDGTLLWSSTSPGQVDAFLTAADMNANGNLEVLVSGRDNRVHMLNGQTGVELARTADTGAWDYGDIDSSPVPILTASGPRAFVGGDAGTAWCLDAQMNTVWNNFVVPNTINSSPIFHDVDNDGLPEMIIGDMRGTIWFIRVATGEVMGRLYVKGGIEGVPLYADIDGDGKMEMVVTTTDGYIIAYRFLNGAPFTTAYLPGNARWRGYT